MGRFYRERLGAEIDFGAVRLAVAFHDSGRQGNGPDLWEDDSAALCAEYGRKTRPAWSEEHCRYVGDLITSFGDRDVHAQLVHDADVLEIMRPCCGHGGLQGFRREVLRFLGPDDPLAVGVAERGECREALVQEAWAWISWTEQQKHRLRDEKAYMDALLDELAWEHARFPLLATLQCQDF
jgi:hypothetical protein